MSRAVYWTFFVTRHVAVAVYAAIYPGHGIEALLERTCLHRLVNTYHIVVGVRFCRLTRVRPIYECVRGVCSHVCCFTCFMMRRSSIFAKYAQLDLFTAS